MSNRIEQIERSEKVHTKGLSGPINCNSDSSDIKLRHNTYENKNRQYKYGYFIKPSDAS